MTDAQLKPCPWCGKPPVQFGNGISGPFFRCGDVNCVASNMGGMIAELWNTRASLSPVVKPLEWGSIYSLGTLEKAETPIGTYTISDDEDKAFGTFVYLHLTPDGDCTKYGLEVLKSGPYEVDEAKAAAEADYEKRILSALTLTQSDKDKEIARLREALIEIERIYYNEGEDVKRRAARMRALASEALEERG